MKYNLTNVKERKEYRTIIKECLTARLEHKGTYLVIDKKSLLGLIGSKIEVELEIQETFACDTKFVTVFLKDIK